MLIMIAKCDRYAIYRACAEGQIFKMQRMRFWAIAVAVGCLAWQFCGSAAAQQYQERYIFDQEGGQWREEEQLAGPSEGIIGQVRELLGQNKGRAAEKLIKKYRKGDPQADDWAELMLLYGDCRLVRGDYYRAHRRYGRVLDKFVGTREYAQAILRELTVAEAFLAGNKRRIWGIFRVSAVDEGLEILTQVEQLGMGYRVAEVALHKKAQYYYRTGQFDLAQISYARLAREYSQGKYKCRAMFRSAQSALASFPGVRFDDTPLLDARERFLQYEQSCAGDSQRQDVELLVNQINGKQAEKEFEVARFYRRVGKANAAVFYYKYVVDTWAETLWAQRARVELLELGYPQAWDQTVLGAEESGK